MSFFKKAARGQALTGQATQTLVLELKQLNVAVQMLLQAPAYAGALETKSPQLLEKTSALFKQLLNTIDIAHLPRPVQANNAPVLETTLRPY